MNFYRCELEPTIDGLMLRTITYVPVHTSPCFYWCVTKSNHRFLEGVEGEANLKTAKKWHRRVRKIQKSGSRIAQPTKDEALESLRARKRWQIMHARREIEIAQAFLKSTKNKQHGDLPRILEDTAEATQENFVFD